MNDENGDKDPGNKKPNDEKKVSFWKTLPGILTQVAATITALATLIAALNQSGLFIDRSNGTNSPIVGQPNLPSIESSISDADAKGNGIFDKENFSPEDLLTFASAEWNLVESDDFSKNSFNWREGERTTGDGRIINISFNGKYQYNVSSAEKDALFKKEKSNIEVPLGSFYLRADMRRVSQGGCGFSALYWGTSNGGYSFRAYDLKRKYSLWNYYYDDGVIKSNGIIPQTGANAINTAELNRLSTVIYNGIVYLFINEEFVNQVPEANAGKGKVGFQFSACDGNSVSYEIDNLEVRAQSE